MNQPARKTRYKAAFTLLEIAGILILASLLSTQAAAKAAFTLIEVCMILIILTVLGGVVLGKLTQDTRRTKASDLQKKLDKIEFALLAFAKVNNRLPCPADGTKRRDSDASFGISADNPGSCVGGALAANFNDGLDTVGGVLPVRTLAHFGLQDEDIFDPTGSVFGYFASKTATDTNALALYPPTATNIGNIRIQDGSGGFRTSSAIALVLSFGPNGHGAYQLSGLRKSANSINTDEQLNCHCDDGATQTVFSNTFSLHPQVVNATNPLNIFDDAGRFYHRSAFNWGIPFPYPLPVPNPIPVPDQPPDSVVDSPPPNPSPGGSPAPAPAPAPDPAPAPPAPAPSPGGCFPCGTMIATPYGKVPIERLQVGDMVMAVREDKSQLPVSIRQLFSRPCQVMEIHTESMILRTTEEHPMWIGGREFRPAGQLKIGDIIMSVIHGGVRPAKISSLTLELGVETVYNIEVDDPHTYIAGGFVVHNKASS